MADKITVALRLVNVTGRPMTAEQTLHDRTEDILYWDESGQVACDAHKPYRWSDTWCMDRWSVFSSRDQDDLAKLTGRESRCEICR